MSKFWQKKYTSKYTGAEIDAAVGNVPVVTSADAGKALVVDEKGKIVAGESGGKIPIIELTADELQVFLGGVIPTLVSLTDKITRAVVNLSAETTHVPEIYQKLKTGFPTFACQGYILIGTNAVMLACCREVNPDEQFIVTEWAPFENQAYNIKCMLAINILLLNTGDVQLHVIAQKMNEAST